MKNSIESILRFVNLASAGLVAGSLSFGGSPLVPGWEGEVPFGSPQLKEPHRHARYIDSIGPVAIVSSVLLAVGTKRRSSIGRVLDAVSAVGLAGVLATTTLGTVPIRKRINEEAPRDYATDSSEDLTRSWSRVHSTRTALGVSAFLCAAASSVLHPRKER